MHNARVRYELLIMSCTLLYTLLGQKSFVCIHENFYYMHRAQLKNWVFKLKYACVYNRQCYNKHTKHIREGRNTMEQLQLISNLDYLRAQNRLEEYVNQYYFFLEQAIQQRDMASVHELLTAYLREVFYSDKRERLEALLQQLEETIIAPEYEQYQPNFYLIKGN